HSEAFDPGLHEKTPWRPPHRAWGSAGSRPSCPPGQRHDTVSATRLRRSREKPGSTLLTPGRWSALVRFNVRSGSDTIEPIPSYGDLETIGYGKDNVMMRQATATTPLRAMPLAVLAHGRPFDLPKETEG